jgi:hypothetical protein
VNKRSTKNLLVTYNPLPLPSALKKRRQFFTKQVDFHSERFEFYCKINDEKFGRNKKALTFALPFKKRVAGKAKKIFESWKTIALYLNTIEVKQKGKSSEIHSI